ncbi:MAG: ShlB/FhaC/HecB family hemolysin secretion/activation protein, partial [Planktomarina sp.]
EENPADTFKLKWVTTFSGQYSKDRLYGGQGYSIGGAGTVRGSRIALASGSSGLLWRNELSTALTDAPHDMFGTIEGYYALDIGRVLPQAGLSPLGGTAVGSVWGLRAKDGPLEVDVSYQRITKTSSHLQKPEGEVFVNLSYTF